MGLRLRWTLLLVGAASVLLFVVGFLVFAGLRRVSGEEEQRWHRARASQLDARLQLEGRIALDATDVIATAMRRDGIDFGEGLPGAVERARQDWTRVQAGREDVAEVLLLDAAGRVLASSDAPTSRGLIHPQADHLRSALGASPVLWSSLRPERPRETVWWVGGVERVGDAGYLAVARSIDEGVLQELSAVLGLRRLDWGAPSSRSSAVALPAGWQLPPGAPTLQWEATASPNSRVLGEVGRWLLGVGVLALLLALIAAPRLAAGLSRPLERIAAAVGELGRGTRRLDLPESGPGEIVQVASALQDLALRLDEAEDDVRRSERRAAWREIARRIAHEIRNVLSPLSLALDNVETAVGRDDEAARHALARSLLTAREQLESLTRLVGEFGEFARQPAPRPETVAVRALCESAVESARATEARAQVSVADFGDFEVHADREQLRRALLNLLRNAIEAAPGSGVELRGAVERDTERWSLEVLDRGPGLAPEIEARLGDPYLTTKSTGTGLGIPLVFRVAEAHGGRVTARPREGGGLIMRIEMERYPSFAREDGEP